MIISFNTGKINTTNSGGGNLQQQKVYVTENGLDVFVPDAGYDGISTIYVKTYVTNDNGLKDYTKIGYSTELNIALNEEIDNNIAESKEAYEYYLKSKPTGAWTLKSKYPNLTYVPYINTSKVTNATRCFENMKNIEVINDYYDWSSCTQFYSFFENSGVKELDLSKWNVSNATNIYSMFKGCQELTKVDLSGWQFPQSKTLTGMFSTCTKLKEIKGVNEWNIENINDISNIFNDSTIISTIDLSKWNTSNITNFSYAFKNCSGLTELNISNWVISMSSGYPMMEKAGAYNSKLIANNCKINGTVNSIFTKCTFYEIDLTGTSFEGVGLLNDVFNGCSMVNTIKGFTIPTSAYQLNSLFYGCSNLLEIDFNGTTTENISRMSSMFYGCSKLTKIPTISTKMISGTPFLSTYPMQSIFYNCTKVVDFGGFVDCENITEWGNASNSPFYYLTSLVNIEQFGTIKGMNFSVYRCTNLSVDSLMVLINALYDYVGNNETPTSTAYSKMTIGSTNLAKLSDEQKAVATAKGWTLA